MLTQVVRGRTYDFSHAVGRRDWGHPVGVAIGPGDDVYILTKQQEQVADVPWNETAIYAKVGKHTIGTVPGDEERVGEFGGYGDTEGKLIWPVGIALDSEQNVYVTDEWLNRVSVFNNNGEFAERWGKDGDRDGEFNRPSGIAVDAKDNLYVVDSLNHRVQRPPLGNATADRALDAVLGHEVEPARGGTDDRLPALHRGVGGTRHQGELLELVTSIGDLRG